MTAFLMLDSESVQRVALATTNDQFRASLMREYVKHAISFINKRQWIAAERLLTAALVQANKGKYNDAKPVIFAAINKVRAARKRA
jgi:hypothetical protein